MKKVLFVTLFLSAALAATAQVNFSGELKPEVIFNIPGSGYDSALNTGNYLGVQDLMFRNEINLKLDQQSDSAALDLWLQVGQYPIAELLAGSAAILTSDEGVVGLAKTAAVGDLAYMAGSYIYTASLMRASASWMPAPEFRVTLGRQSFLTGYGYGWNPVDLANPPKDPTDPSAYLQGVDGLTLQGTPFSWLSVKAYGIAPSEGSGWAYNELLAGAELTLQMPALEVKLAGLYGGRERNSDLYDLYPHGAAAAFYADVHGVGLYGEGVVRSRSRRNSADPAGGTSVLSDEPVFSALGGAEYYFASGLSGAVEYFYNGEGWDDDQRSDYASALEVLGGMPGADYLGLYTPMYFARHYILLNLMIPWYEKDSSFNANIIYSPDSKALFVTPSASFNLNYEGTLVSEFWYSGMFSLDDGEKDEAWLSPVSHSVMVNLRYYF